MTTTSALELQHHSLADFIEATLAKFAEKPAFSCLGQTLSFAEIEQKSRALACFLQEHPAINAGDRIAIQLPNLIQYPIAAYGALRAGLVLVNTNPLYTPREMQHQFKDSGAKVLVILEDLLPKFDAIKSETEVELVITTKAPDLLMPDAKDAPQGCTSLNAILTDYHSQTLLKRPTVSGDDNCVLQYTGGTTGVSKGACLSHHNVIANAVQVFERLDDKCIEGEETFVCPLPLYHIYAFTVNMVMFFSRGSLNVLIPNPRDLDAFVNQIKPFQFTGFSGINTLFVGLCHHPAFKTLDFSKLKLTISGGTALTSSAVDIWKQVTSCSITEGYGLSETSPVLCFNTPDHEVLGSVGKPLVGTEIELWNDKDEVAEEGQIVARGPQVMSGYWNMPDETAKVMKDGFFKTGDVGIRLDSGEIKIVDRLKDMIIVSGFNVYPNEVEDVLTKHNSILEAAVIGEPDDKTGEKVAAYITIEASVTAEEVIEHCRAHLTAYKVPKKVVVLDELPKSTVGKILRRELRK
ncbi:long-chain-fatty-acid--CoA ligase [Thalassotalea loyana]|uniref:Long-chain-fatty-acid--CoA ligase n=1 Tax=Thalassotalea loyana TaxID=280483 RepID=A0ABQ6HDF4_9GAMM|nr:AMP-binding protein [Thalassotalea loyana]GLX86128.1 long-chain-fatty-acid--CoA ligase [Thalassotalea loyana]